MVYVGQRMKKCIDDALKSKEIEPRTLLGQYARAGEWIENPVLAPLPVLITICRRLGLSRQFMRILAAVKPIQFLVNERD